MDEDKTITANFNQIGVITYNLTISINGQGTTNPSAGTYPYAEGTVVDVSAIPSNGWVFVNWSGDTGTIDDINDPDITITMNNNYTITANFSELPQYTLTIDVDGEGTTSGAGTYYQGEDVSIRANPASGWKFGFWSGESTTIDDVDDSTTTITMNDDYTITANFVEIELFTLTIIVNGNGSTNPTVGEHEYKEGTVVNISAIPDQDWQFASWSGDVANPNSSSTTVTMDASKSITANFNPFGVTTYLLTITINGQGTTNPSEGDHSYARGKVVTVTAIAEDGWYFDSWSGDTSLLSNVNNPTTTITMNDNVEITANFSKEDDTTAPIIPVALATNITKTGADIFWVTDEPSDSQVDYWASPGELTPLDTALVTEHLVRLSELEPATTYHYKVMSRDEAGNLVVSDEFTFTTMGKSASFSTSKWEASIEELDDGKEVSIVFLVTNTGDIAGSYQASLSINGGVEETKNLDLTAGASQEITFTVNQNAVGTYIVTVDELTLSFTVDSGGGINWWLIIGIIVGVLLIITFCVFYIIRRMRSKDDYIPKLRITEKETFEETEEEDFGKGIEEDTSAGTLVTHFGLTVTAMARMKLKEALLSKTKDPKKGFRITLSPDKPGQLKMILDNEKEGDQIITSNGTKILFISKDVIPNLEGMAIDYQVTPEGSGFNISTLSKD
jgi:Fe-S cluster assembly iron-binding protein IscA